MATLKGGRFLGLQVDVHVSKPHLHRAHAMDSLEISIKVADFAVAAIGGDRLNGRRDILEQLGGSRHAYIEQVLAKGLADIPVEQPEKPGLSDPQQVADLLRRDTKGASVSVDDSQENADTGVHQSCFAVALATIA